MVLRTLFTLPVFAGAAEPTPPKGYAAIFNGTDFAGWHGWAIHDKGATPPEMAKAKPEDNAKLVEKYTADAKKHWSSKDGASEAIEDSLALGLRPKSDSGSRQPPEQFGILGEHHLRGLQKRLIGCRVPIEPWGRFIFSAGGVKSARRFGERDHRAMRCRSTG